MKDVEKPSRRAKAPATSSEGFTAEEREAMKERARELRTASRRGSASAKEEEEERDVLAKIAEMPEPDRSLAERVHAIIRASAPALSPKLWYGSPAYAKDGKVICFFQNAQRFKTRYATLGFSDAANLDEGTLWPTSFALTALTAEDETKIGALVKRAAG